MLHIKLKGMEHRVPCYHIFCPYTHPRPLGWGQKSFFLKVVMLQIKIKGMEHSAPFKHLLCPYKHPQPLDGVKRQDIFFAEKVMLHIKLMGMEHKVSCKHRVCPYTQPRPLGVKGQIIFIGKKVYCILKLHSL